MFDQNSFIPVLHIEKLPAPKESGKKIAEFVRVTEILAEDVDGNVVSLKHNIPPEFLWDKTKGQLLAELSTKEADRDAHRGKEDAALQKQIDDLTAL